VVVFVSPVAAVIAVVFISGAVSSSPAWQSRRCRHFAPVVVAVAVSAIQAPMQSQCSRRQLASAVVVMVSADRTYRLRRAAAAAAVAFLIILVVSIEATSTICGRRHHFIVAAVCADAV
jgi:hypothetical protein